MQATLKQVRDSYKASGLDVRISRDGHVTYRTPGRKCMWLEGRWTEEYRVDADTGSVYLA
jgi:hypothetical protein